MAEPTHYSLRRRLVWLLLVATLFAAIAQGLIAYRAAIREADRIFEAQMQQIAMALRGDIRAADPARTPPRRDPQPQSRHDVVIHIWTADGVTVYQTHERIQLPRAATPGFSETRVDGKTWRMYSLRSGGQLVRVAQDTAARDEMARALAWQSLQPVLLFAALMMLAIWLVVSRALRPVSAATQMVSQRAVNDVSPLPQAGLPSEIVPLVGALNALFLRVRDAFDAQRHFIAEAAHELRSPLTALRLQLQSLERAPDEAARALAVQRLRAGIERATRLVEQLLVLARQEAPALHQEPLQPLALAEIARATIAEVAPSADERGVDVGINLPEHAPPLPALVGDPEALRVLLRNLLDNAVKYTPPHGRVDLGIESDPRQVRLIVDDSGPGIPESERQRVFDRFHRGRGATGSGSGLGLAIVRAIAQRHGGDVRLLPSPLGGLRAVLELPAGAPAQEIGRAAAPPTPSSDASIPRDSG
ncbi:MAG TPA: ATP-binding protein [Burkholderiaceae bacterium]|nr:ATP-binding protein [Burkholderiaceae bacterium]